MLTIRTILLIAISFFAGAATAWANPNHKDPNAYLPAHGEAEVKALYGNTIKLADGALKEMGQQLEAASKGRLRTLSGKQIAATRTKMLQTIRFSEHLQTYGEPTAVEIPMRLSVFGALYHTQVVKAYPGQPTSARFMTQLRAAMNKQAPARVKAAARLQQLVVQKKWQAAADGLYKVYDALELAGIAFLTDSEQRVIRTPFDEVSAVIETAARRLRSEQAAKVLAESRAKQLPDFAAILTEIKQAAASVGTTGQAVWKEETVDGPQLVEKIGVAWKEAHVATLRCRAVDWAGLARAKHSGYEPAMEMENPSRSDPLRTAYRDFTVNMLDAIAQLLRGEKARGEEQDTVALYVRYLQTLSPLMDQVADEYSLAPVDEALRSLAGKVDGFGEEVDAYAVGTAQMLRWRARAATAMARTRQEQFAALPTTMFQATKSDQNYTGLFTALRPEEARPRFLACAPKILPPAIEKLVGQKVRVGSVRRVTPTSRSAIAEFERRTYANLPAGLPLAAEVDSLKFDLMVSDDAPPLTLASAMAVDSAVRGDLAAAGGEITGTHLEALITRFATLPTAASVLVPLGNLPTENQDYLLHQALMRFDLQPSWAQHEHFFVELSAASDE